MPSMLPTLMAAVNSVKKRQKSSMHRLENVYSAVSGMRLALSQRWTWVKFFFTQVNPAEPINLQTLPNTTHDTDTRCSQTHPPLTYT